MMKKLPTFFLKGIMAAFLLWGASATAQLNYTQDFEDEDHGWTIEEFEQTDEAPCAGMGALRGNAYFFFGIIPVAPQTVSPNLGVSNGLPVTLSYSYMLTEWGEAPLTALENDIDWGAVTVQYAASETGPWLPVETIDNSNHTVSDMCVTHTATFTPASGSNIYLRFIASPENGSDYFFYFDDVSLTQAALVACNGTPAAGATVSSRATACTNQQFTLSLNPAYVNSGLTFQWQSSTDGTNFTNIAASPNAGNYTTTQPAATWYRALVSCSAGGTPVATTPVQVLSTGGICYCEIGFTDTVEPITLVNFAGINNITSEVVDGTPSYEDFTSTVAPATVTQGVPYTITLKGNTAGDWLNYFMVYIDFNRDGDFEDAGEAFEAGEIENSEGTDDVQATTQILIPSTASLGATRMRVVKVYEEEIAGPCGTGEDLQFGQAEDYAINIVAMQACASAPTAPVITAEDTTLCGTEGTTLSMTSVIEQSGISLVWQSSTDGTTFTDITGATGDEYEVASVTGTIWYRLVAICQNGNLSTPSQPVQLTLTSAVCYCEVEITSGVEPITSVSVGTLINTSAASDDENQMEDFTALDAPVLNQGQAYPVALMGNTAGDFTNYFTIFIDWNQNGDLSDDGEVFEIGTVENSTGTDGISAEGSIVVPQTASLGYTHMRVAKRFSSSLTDPCGTMSFGQVEDYRVFISTSAGTGEFNANAMSYYPNPVKDVLNLRYSNGAIDSIAVYNLLGQQVIASKAVGADASVDMSSLAAGTYIVKASAADGVKTIKIIKE